MTALLAITCALLMVSAAAKARAGLRVGLGIDLITVAEFAFGVIVGLSTMASAALGVNPATAWLVPGGVFAVMASTASFGFKMSAYRRRREELQASRLVSYVKYFHKVDDAEEADD